MSLVQVKWSIRIHDGKPEAQRSADGKGNCFVVLRYLRRSRRLVTDVPDVGGVNSHQGVTRLKKNLTTYHTEDYWTGIH